MSRTHRNQISASLMCNPNTLDLLQTDAKVLCSIGALLDRFGGDPKFCGYTLMKLHVPLGEGSVSSLKIWDLTKAM